MKATVPAAKRRRNRFRCQFLIGATFILLSSVTTNGQSIWSSDFFRCPLTVLARGQVTRRLERLSNNLRDLANDKQDLAEALSTTNQEDIRARITELQDTVKRLRRNINTFTSLLHPSDRRRGEEIGNEIFQGLTRKIEILEAARNNLDNGTKDQIRMILRDGLDELRRVQREVDGLITELAQPCP